MHIYLINAEGTNRYKIGITSRTIESRLKELNGTQSAYPLRLISSARNAQFREVESHLHETYKANRCHGEWFTFDPYELEEVKKYLATFDTPTRNIKPIFKPSFTRNNPVIVPHIFTRKNPVSLPQISYKKWLSPLLIAVGLIVILHRLEFFNAPTQQVQTVHHKRAK